MLQEGALTSFALCMIVTYIARTRS